MSKKVDNYYKFDDSRKIKDSELIKRLGVYFKPYLIQFIIVCITLIFTAALINEVLPLFGNIMDMLDDPGRTYNDLLPLIYRVIIYILVYSVISFLRGIYMNSTCEKILLKLRGDLFSHIEGLSLSELDKTPVGTFVTRVTNDTNSLSELFANVLVNLISQIFTLIYAVILMFRENVTLSWYVMLTVPFIVISTVVFSVISRNLHRRITYDRSKTNAFLSENLSGMKITQIFNKEEAKLAEFDALNKRLHRNQFTATYTFGIFRPLLFFGYFLGVVVVYYFGSKLCFEGLLTTGALYTFYMLLSNLFNPIQNIAQQFNTIQSGFASAEKIYTILDTKSSIKVADSPITEFEFKGEIEFKDVWFKYDKEWIIKGISFHVMPGQTVSFVGPTGAGKTTILSLIGRYYDVDQGEILIDGINIKDYEIHALRENIGEMLQDVFLFSGTIKKNLTLGDESITDSELVEACKYVNADKFINKLEGKYDEIVKERGNNYSQGERQLLSFARTILAKPKMIILDEATSNIDTETEVLIQDSLQKLLKVGTTLMVAHRLSTIQHSDIIMFIDGGKVVEAGSHSELLKQKGRYYTLYRLQYDKK